MDVHKGKVEKYVSRFCSLLDELSRAFEEDPHNRDRHRKLATKAQFLGCKLGLVRNPDWQCLSLLAPLGWDWPDLTQGTRDERHVQQQIKDKQQSRERVRRFQAEAQALRAQDVALEPTPMVDRTNLAEDIRDFCSCIDQVIEIYEMPHENPEIHRFGKRANKLAMKVGLMCHARPLALACYVPQRDDKIPYVEKKWWELVRAMTGEFDSGPINRWNEWKRRAEALLKTSSNRSVSGLPQAPEARESAATHRMQYDFFISHASEDKGDFVRPLAKSLRDLGARVWYDEFTLKVGDSLRRSIDSGLRNSRYGIVVLSNSFFAKDWPQRELDGLLSQEVNGLNVILPIWHGVTKDEVRRYSPLLADKVALVSATTGIAEIAAKFMEELRPQDSGGGIVSDRSDSTNG